MKMFPVGYQKKANINHFTISFYCLFLASIERGDPDLKLDTRYNLHHFFFASLIPLLFFFFEMDHVL